jgi:hypothetical protein
MHHHEGVTLEYKTGSLAPKRCYPGFDFSVAADTHHFTATPINAAAPEPEVRSAIFLSPYGWMQRSSAVCMPRDLPAWPLVRKQVHVQHAPASAGTEHCRLFLKPVFLHYV